MGFISSIFCGSSDNHQNGTSASGSTHHGSTASSGPNSHHSKLRQKTSTPPTTTNINTATSANSQTNNGGRPTHKASPATSNGNLKKQRSSHSKNTISTKTTTTRTKETVGANAHNGSSSSSSSSSRKQVKVANAHAPTNGYGNSQGTTTPTPRTSTSSSLSVTNEKSKMAKNENFEEEKNYTVVSEQVGEEEEEEEEENEDNAENNKEKEPEDDVNYEMDVDSDSEQQPVSKTALHEQQQMTLQGGVPVDELQAALPHTINANSSVVVHETIQNSDSECSVPGTPPPASLTHNQQQHEASLPPPSLEAQQQYQDEQQQMMAQMSGEITPMMESNFIDLTKLQKGQAHAKGCETLLGIKDKEVFGNKKCLVLDLDETLVHSSFKYVRAADFVIPVEIDNQVHNVYVIKRPGVDKFLETVAKYYEVVVFTASVSRYGDPLLDILDNVKTNHGGKLNIHHRLFRDSCYTYEGNYVKNLSQIGRPLEDIIILDNSPASYIFHPQHAVPISSWFSDTHDNELIDILPILTDLSGVPDVSMVLDVSL